MILTVSVGVWAWNLQERGTRLRCLGQRLLHQAGEVRQLPLHVFDPQPAN
jgi:hypothetical protein